MKRRRRHLGVALGSQLLAIFLAASIVRPGFSEPGQVLETEVPIFGGDTPEALEIKDGDATVSPQTGAFQYSYPIEVPPGRLGMQPQLALRYSSQAPIYGGLAAGWSMDVPEIRLDSSEGRLKWKQGTSGSFDVPFVSTLAGGNRLVEVTEPRAADVAQTYRAQDDSTYARYERLKTDHRWRVLATDGTVYDFNQPDHIVDPQGDPVAIGFAGRAPLTRQSDAFGNAIDYYWRQAGSGGFKDDAVPFVARDLILSRIEYTSNEAAGLPAFARISFEYSPQVRCDGSTLPVGAQHSLRDGEIAWRGARRLDAIHISLLDGSAHPRRRLVRLGYDTSAEACGQEHGAFRVLTSITESATSPDGFPVSKPAIKFSYGPYRQDFDVTTAASFGLFQRGQNVNPTLPNASWPTLESMMIDLDGDGRLDRIQMSGTTGVVHWYRNVPDTLGAPSWQLQTARFTLPKLPVLQNDFTPAGGFRSHVSLAGEVTDIQNVLPPQGYEVEWGDNQSKWCPGPENGGTFVPYRFLDMDGDGLPDLVTSINADPLFYQPWPISEHPGHQALMDSWGLVDCETYVEPTNTHACPVIPPEDLEATIECTEGPFETCAFDEGVLSQELVATDRTTCDVLNGGPQVTYARHHPAGRTVWTDIFGNTQETIPLPSPEDTEPQCRPGAFRAPTLYCKRYAWHWYRNRGNAQFEGLNYFAGGARGRTTLSPVPLEPSVDNLPLGGRGGGLSSSKHAIIDIDGDGFLDAVMSSTHPDEMVPESVPHTGWFVWRGNADGKFLPDPATQQPYVWLTPSGVISASGLISSLPAPSGSVSQLVDMNGDGLVDLVRKRTKSEALRVWFNDGTQFRGGPSGLLSLPAAIESLHVSKKTLDQTPGNHTGTREDRLFSMDVDADGRADIVHQGLGTTAGATTLAFSDGAGLYDAVPSSAGGTVHDRMRQELSADSSGWYVDQDAVDVDGDGAIDLVSTIDGNFLTDQKDGKPNLLLHRVDNGAGGIVDVRYATLTDPVVKIGGSASGRSRPMWVVKSMTTRNLHVGKWPADPSTPAPVVGETSYLYGEPVWNQDPYGKWGFRGFKNVDALGPEDAQQKRSKVSSQFYYSTDYSGRLLETVTYEDSTSDYPDSIRRTEHQALFMFDDGDSVLEPGEVRSVQEYVDQSFTCRAGETYSQCKDPLTRHLLQVYTTWNGFPTAGPTRVYVPTSIRKTRSDSEASLHDKQIYRKFALVNTASDYRVRQTLEELRERNYDPWGEIVYQKHYQRTLHWDPDFRGQVGNSEETTATNVVRTEWFILDPLTGVMTAKKRFNQYALGAAGKLISFTHDKHQVHVASTTNELEQTVYTTYDLATGALLSTRGPNSYTPPDGGATEYEETKTTIDGFGRKRGQWVALDKAGGGYRLRQTLLPPFTQISGTIYTDLESPQRIWEARTLDFDTGAATVTVTMYDGFGRVMKTVEQSQDGSPDKVTILRYDNRGNLVEVMAQDPSVNTQTPAVYTFAYDRLGRLKEATRPMVDGFQGGFTISRDGPVETRTEKARAKHPAATTRTTRDVFDRLIMVEELKDSDAPGAYATTGYEYDGFDNLVRVVSADGNTTTLGYDFVSRRTSISRGGRTWRYEYDDNDNLIHEIAPHTSGTDAEYTTVVVYDELDRPTSRLAGVRALTSDQLAEIGHGPTVFTYDRGQNGKGRLTAVTTPSSTVSFAYDARGQVVSQTRSFDLANELNLAPGSFGDTRTQTFSYNAAGQVISASHGDSAPGQAATQSTTAYDLRGLPAGLIVNRGGTTSTVATVVDRNVAGLLTTLASPLPTVDREATQKWSRDVLGRVLSHEIRQTSPGSGNALLIAEAMTDLDADDALLIAETITYLDTDDVATLRSERVGLAPRSFVFGYDDRHQLEHADDGEYIADFDFSDGGLLTRANITAPAGAPQATSRDVLYEYTGGATHDPEAVNRLANQADGTDFVTYAYDDSGNVTLREQASGTFAFLYDGDDQQRRAIAPDGDQELYYYDESGQRILAVTRAAGGAVTKARFWMGGLEVEYSGLGAPTKTLAHLSLGTPVARVENRTTLEYQFHGGLGHLLGAMPEVGPGLALSVAYQYGPFGEILAQAGSTTDHTRRFNGKERDALSGLNYYGFRYYDPLSLQWTQADPLYRFRPELAYNEPRRLNLYGFTLQNPARFVDPDGRDPDINAEILIELQMAKAGVDPAASWPAMDALVSALMPDEFDASLAAAGVAVDGPLPFGDVAAGGIIGVRTVGKIPDAIKAAARAGDDVAILAGNKVDDVAKTITVSSSRHPQSAAHIKAAQKAGKPQKLTIDRAGAKDRRAAALKGKESKPGTDRDEYPPAMFKEGGSEASVRDIKPGDNRGAGACIGNQCRGLPDGTTVKIEAGE